MLSIVITLFLSSCDVTHGYEAEELTSHPGHLHKFASRGPLKNVEELNYFPNTEEFFENYVAKNVPLIMRGVTKDSKPYNTWTDEYFLNNPIFAEEIVKVQNKKNMVFNHQMNFHDFLRTYKTTNDYMESDVIPVLRPDVTFPKPLQCDYLLSTFHSAQMWLTNGGTQSLVHNDGADNIICVFAGEKDTTLIHPDEYLNKKEIPGKSVAVANITIDKVDYTKHPELADIAQFHKAYLHPGDCLYIPYNWIHQVNSYQRNVAVNVWWYHQDNTSEVITECQGNEKIDFTLQDVHHPTDFQMDMSNMLFNYFVLDLTRERPLAVDAFYDYIVRLLPVEQYFVRIFRAPDDHVPVGFGTHMEELLQQIATNPEIIQEYMVKVKPLIAKIDVNKDGELSSDEFLSLAETDIDAIVLNLRDLQTRALKLVIYLKDMNEDVNPMIQKDHMQDEL